MNENSVTYEASFSLDYDPGIFFIPGIGASIAAPNVGSIFNIAGALDQAQSLLDKAKSAVSIASGGSLSFDASAVADFATNAAVSAAQDVLKNGDFSEITEATNFLSSFSPGELASINSFNQIASAISAPQSLVSEVSGLAEKASGTLSSFVSSQVESLTGAITGNISSAASALAGSLGPQAASLVGGALPTAEMWSTVFGSSFNTDLAPFLNLSLSQLVPPINQVIESEIGGLTYGVGVSVPNVSVPVLGSI